LFGKNDLQLHMGFRPEYRQVSVMWNLRPLHHQIVRPKEILCREEMWRATDWIAVRVEHVLAEPLQFGDIVECRRFASQPITSNEQNESKLSEIHRQRQSGYRQKRAQSTHRAVGKDAATTERIDLIPKHNIPCLRKTRICHKKETMDRKKPDSLHAMDALDSFRSHRQNNRKE